MRWTGLSGLTLTVYSREKKVRYRYRSRLDSCFYC